MPLAHETQYKLVKIKINKKKMLLLMVNRVYCLRMLSVKFRGNVGAEVCGLTGGKSRNFFYKEEFITTKKRKY